MRKIYKIVFTLSILVQTLLMAGMYFLQGLTRKKAGVNHHLRYRKTQYAYQYLTEMNVRVLSVVLLLIMGLLLISFVRVAKKSMLTEKIGLVIATVWRGIILMTLHGKYFQALLVYPYLIFAELICLVISIIIVGIGKCRKIK